MPINLINRDFVIREIANVSYFITPHIRIITNIGVKQLCNSEFHSKFKTIDNKWIAHTKHGIEQADEPRIFEWSKKWEFIDEKKSIEFGIDKGIYRWDTIEEFDKNQNFRGMKEAIIAQMAGNMKDGKREGEKHQVKKYTSKMSFLSTLGKISVKTW